MALTYFPSHISFNMAKFQKVFAGRSLPTPGLDQAHVFIVDRYFVCKRESFFLYFLWLNFYREFASDKKWIFFSAKMTVVVCATQQRGAQHNQI